MIADLRAVVLRGRNGPTFARRVAPADLAVVAMHTATEVPQAYAAATRATLILARILSNDFVVQLKG